MLRLLDMHTHHVKMEVGGHIQCIQKGLINYILPTGQSLTFPTAPAFLSRSPNLLGWRVSPLSCIVRDCDLKHNYTLENTLCKEGYLKPLTGENYQRIRNLDAVGFPLYLHGNKVGKKLLPGLQSDPHGPLVNS